MSLNINLHCKMTKFLSYIFLLLFLLPPVIGQSQNLILTREQNDLWFDSLKTFPLEKQLNVINERLFADTKIFTRQMYPDGLKNNDSLGKRVYGDSRLKLFISGYSIFIENNTPIEKIVRLTNLLNTVYIKDISFLDPHDPKTTALFGTSGYYGIIIMTVTKKKYAKLFKRLKI